jgi:outer membrane immunogenic protein
MKRLLLAGFATLSIFNAGFADAADIDVAANPTASRVIVPAPYFEWFGLYIGAIGGGGWEHVETNYTGSAVANGFLPTGFGKHTIGFGTAGGLIGMNFQMAQVVFGIEGDFSWVGGARTTHFTAQIPVTNVGTVTSTVTQTEGLRWLTTARGRVGYAINNVLLFATGGAAIGGLSATTNVVLFDGTHTDIFTGSARFGAGFTIGGGIEYAFTENLLIKGEYLFFDLGTVRPAITAANLSGVGKGLSINASQKIDGNIFRLGLIYKPDWL